jgi:hypothetical protein
MDNFIEVFPNALSKKTCDDIIKICKVKSQLATDDKDNEYYHCVRKVSDNHRNDISIFPGPFQTLAPFTKILLDTFTKHPSKYLSHLNLAEHVVNNDIKYQLSTSGGGFYNWHTEQGDSPSTAERFMVWMIYLNDVDKGGRTEFKHFKNKKGNPISFKPKAGTLLYWPAGYTHVHRAAPDLKQDKWIATGWFNYNIDPIDREINTTNSSKSGKASWVDDQTVGRKNRST